MRILQLAISHGLILLLSFSVRSFAAEPSNSTKVPDVCRRWFDKSKVATGKSCEIKCALMKSDMGTFDCSRFCDDLCAPSEKSPSNSVGVRLASVYPGLTDAEKRFVERNPGPALQAYLLSWRAESLCKDIYFVSDTNDESDACRHFLWAALLNAKFGTKITTELLDAHEQNPDQPEDEKSMDLANNRRGLIASSELIKSNKNSESEFLKQFLSDLKEGKIIVLKRKKP